MLPEEVMFLETVGNYTRIFISNDSYFEVRSSLTTAQKKLPNDIFIKIHRSYVVSIYYIQTIEKDHLVIDGITIPIGPQFYEPLIKKLNVIK